MRQQVVTGDPAVAAIAARRHDVVTFEQMRRVGLDASAVARRVRAGRFHRVHRGVYAIGHPGLALETMWMAAALACGGGAAVRHRSAAQLWGLLPRTTEVIDISVSRIGGKAIRKGIRLHRSRTLTLALITRRKNIPVTKPGRTIADLRRVASAKELRRAIRQAEVLGLPLGPDVESDPNPQ